MASGQQKAQQNLEAFEVWKATQTDDDFKQIVFRGQLNRIEVAKGIGCGKSALNQNPALKKALIELEDKLRDKGVLPPLTKAAKQKKNNPQVYHYVEKSKSSDSKRIAELEAENLELRARLEKFERSLERYSEHAETMSELGLIRDE